MSKAYAESVFSKAFNHETTKKVEFNPEWNNGTGYFDALKQEDLGLAVGELAAIWTGNTNRRRIIVVGTMFGNVVVFDRFTDNDKIDAPVWVIHTPHILQSTGMLKEGSQSGDDLYALVGDPEYRTIAPNIGTRLAELKEAFANPPVPRRRPVAVRPE